MIIIGKAFENITYYEQGEKGDFDHKIEELGEDIGFVAINVDGVIDLDIEEKILPQEIIGAAHEYPILFRFLSFTISSAITNPKDYAGTAVRAYKTKDHAQALLLAELVSGWLGGSYIIVYRHNHHERYSEMWKPTYYIWSEGKRYYLEAKGRSHRVPSFIQGAPKNETKS